MSTSTGFMYLRFGVLCCALALLGIFPGLTQAAPPPAAPPLLQDAGQPNLFYGAIPPNGPNGPVLVLVHGLDGNYTNWIETSNCPTTISGCKGSNNTMYDAMYQSGFRVALMSLSLDNSKNTADIQTNAAMLQTVFPKILAHFNVSKVDFIAHSKGGLDLQDAIANPQWLSMANFVLMMGTPSQGDALADWCYGAGAATCGPLGLQNPAVQSMETANVLQLRTQWDPVFANAQIPFYTLKGNTYKCQQATGTCATEITGPILVTLTGGFKHAPPNDGLVTEPETVLPTTYSMDLGVVHCNHYGLVQGVNTFVFVQGRVLQWDNSQPGLTKVGTGGFGDEHNTWAWAMAWFNGKLYVGTGREVYCVTSATAFVQLGLPGLYPPAIGDCSPDYHHLPLQGEIWQYTPSTNTWVRVFQSPNSLTTTDNNHKVIPTARDIGFRSFSLVTEPGGVQALYAGGVTSGEIFQTATSGSWPPPRVLRSVDGVTWKPLPQDPGTFLGSLTINGTSQYPNFSIRSGQQLNGILFLQVGDYPGVGRVISSIPGHSPAEGNNAYQWASPPTADLPVWILQNYNGFVYAGTGTPPGAPAQTYGVFKTNGTGPAPYTWTQVITNGGFALPPLVADYAMSLEIFSTPDCPAPLGCLYVGTDRPNEMVRVHPDDTWDLVIGNPRTIPPGQPGAGQLKAPLSGMGQYFVNGFTGHFWKEGVNYQGTKMYMGTWDWSSDNAYQPTFAPLWSQEFGTDLWSTTDGTHWYSVSKIGLGDGNNTGSRSFVSSPFGLFEGTARSIGGAQVFRVDNSNLDYNNDGVIDQFDVNAVSARLGNPATGKNDPMDLNQNGTIDPEDVTLLQTQCTYPGCQVPATLPPYITVQAPLLYSKPGQLAVGAPVYLSWSAVSNAAYYSVYRIALSSSETTPPPGLGGGSAILTRGLSTTNSALAKACRTNALVGRLQTCYPYNLPSGKSGGTPLFGYPGPPQLLGRFPAATLTYTETALSSLQSLYYVRAEDASGNISTPSNIVGGPSLAPQ